MPPVDTILKHIEEIGRVISNAPVTAILLILLGWALARLHYGGRLATAADHLKYKADQLAEYKDKLKGASPDEARKLIAALQSQLDRLTPRHIPKEKQATLLKLARPPSDGSGIVDIFWESTASDSNRIAYDFCNLFESTGWTVQQSREFGGDIKPGITLTLRDPESAADSVVRDVFEESGLAFKVERKAALKVPLVEIGHPWD